MARIRSVHPGLFTDEHFVSLPSDAARLLFIGLWTEADDRGLFEWRIHRVKMRLRAWDGVDCAPLLDSLAQSGLVRRYEVDGREYGAIKNFCRWQRPKSPQYLHPSTPEIDSLVGFREASERDESTRGTALARLLCERQDCACHYCGTEITYLRKKATSLEIDHATPVSRGGADTIDNLVAACRPCNALKRNMTADEFVAKFAQRELRENSDRQRSRTAKAPNEEMPPQREEGGDSRREGEGERGAAAPSAKGSRLPTDWQLPFEWASWAKQERPDLSPSAEAERFRDYWTAQPGQKGRKTNWQGTWRNWIRGAKAGPAPPQSASRIGPW